MAGTCRRHGAPWRSGTSPPEGAARPATRSSRGRSPEGCADAFIAFKFMCVGMKTCTPALLLSRGRTPERLCLRAVLWASLRFDRRLDFWACGRHFGKPEGLYDIFSGSSAVLYILVEPSVSSTSSTSVRSDRGERGHDQIAPSPRHHGAPRRDDEVLKARLCRHMSPCAFGATMKALHRCAPGSFTFSLKGFARAFD